jgi:hypothetical protein
MSTIRPTLFEKFGKIPVLDTYRQAAIRCQKVRDWTAMRDWAERGLSVYGEQAARLEVVVDLEKRRAYATAKLEAAGKPGPPRRAKATPVAVWTAPSAPVLETLVCTNCSQTFERERTRVANPTPAPTVAAQSMDDPTRLRDGSMRERSVAGSCNGCGQTIMEAISCSAWTLGVVCRLVHSLAPLREARAT